MAKWKIERTWHAGPEPGSDRDAAFAFELSAEGQPNRQLTVEYAAPSTKASQAHAMQAVHRHLNEDEPPRRLLVARNGDARPVE